MPSAVTHFYSGQPMHFCSGVDTGRFFYNHRSPYAAHGGYERMQLFELPLLRHLSGMVSAGFAKAEIRQSLASVIALYRRAFPAISTVTVQFSPLTTPARHLCPARSKENSRNEQKGVTAREVALRYELAKRPRTDLQVQRRGWHRAMALPLTHRQSRSISSFTTRSVPGSKVPSYRSPLSFVAFTL